MFQHAVPAWVLITLDCPHPALPLQGVFRGAAERGVFAEVPLDELSIWALGFSPNTALFMLVFAGFFCLLCYYHCYNTQFIIHRWLSDLCIDNLLKLNCIDVIRLCVYRSCPHPWPEHYCALLFTGKHNDLSGQVTLKQENQTGGLNSDWASAKHIQTRNTAQRGLSI